MKTKLTNGSLALLLILSMCFLGGCKKKTQAAFVPKLDTQTKCKILIAGRYQNFEALEAEFDRFNEFYPNVELSYTYLDNYKVTISTALAGQDAPDIFMTFPWMLDKTNYDPLLENAENLADSKATGIELSAISKKLLFYMDDGSLPMVPVLSATNGMLVNEDLFKKEGIEVPTNYKQLIEACQKFQAAGYKSPILSEKSANSIMASLIYAYFTKEVMNDKDAIAKLNSLDSAAGEYMRSTLEWVQEFKKYGFMDLDECAKIKDNYSAVIMRFFQGDVPMMLASADVVSGTKKREGLSEAFTANPFKYSFYAVPVLEKGSAILEVPSVEFSVNKNSKNLEMTNEFMRFLLRTQELNNLAMIKRLITCSTVYSFDDVYAPLGNTEHLYQLELGILDNTYTQLRNAAYQVLIDKRTIDEAILNYGKY
ncbi:MAG: extracellular solute-binding protein [Treponema sp.]|nr:extracellular solute-binding protein [Treponema sp.]